MDSEEEDISEHDSTEIFSDALSDLKQHGGNLLIIGPTHENVHRQLCLRMLGDETAAPRRRVIVYGGSTGHTAIDSLSPGSQQSSSAKIIDHSTQPRGAVHQTNSKQSQSFKTYTTTGQLSELEDAIFESIAQYENLTDGFSPAELRVCVDSLLSISNEYDCETVARFLYGVTQKIRCFDGLGHFHLPVARDEQIVADLIPFFDVLVELRVAEKSPQQCWYLCDSGVESEWLPVPPPADIK